MTLTLIVGPLFSWISCWTIAALGQAASNTEAILERLGNVEEKLYKLEKSANNPDSDVKADEKKEKEFVLPPL